MNKRNSTEIRVWMLRNKVSTVGISKATGLNKSNVTRTIDGERNCRAVLQFLIDMGCQEKHLDLPADMLRAA